MKKSSSLSFSSGYFSDVPYSFWPIPLSVVSMRRMATQPRIGTSQSSCHQPLLPISCNLLAPTARLGRIIASENKLYLSDSKGRRNSFTDLKNVDNKNNQFDDLKQLCLHIFLSYATKQESMKVGLISYYFDYIVELKNKNFNMRLEDPLVLMKPRKRTDPLLENFRKALKNDRFDFIAIQHH